jgi:NAD(P)-dependent dehydrogenase (short-subunit alcohol dehydrogenase family)
MMSHPRTFVIFGASGGIGSAIARTVTAQGDQVLAVARSTERLTAACPTATHFVCDVTDGAALGATCAAIQQAAPRIDGIVYAVGSIVLKPLKAARESDYLDAFRLNVVGAAEAIRLLQPALSDTSSIVLFSTVAAGQGFPNHSVIAAAKGGVEALTRTLAAELAPRTRVNCLAPSLTQTPLAAQLTKSETMAAAIAGMHPIPRLGTPDDSAALAAFLLSEQSGWITGQVIGVDGGRGVLRVKG